MTKLDQPTVLTFPIDDPSETILITEAVNVARAMFDIIEGIQSR